MSFAGQKRTAFEWLQKAGLSLTLASPHKCKTLWVLFAFLKGVSQIEVTLLTFGCVKQRRTGQISRFPCVAPYHFLSLIICCSHIKIGTLSIDMLSMVCNNVLDFIYDTHGRRITQWNPTVLSPAVWRGILDKNAI